MDNDYDNNDDNDDTDEGDEGDEGDDVSRVARRRGVSAVSQPPSRLSSSSYPGRIELCLSI